MLHEQLLGADHHPNAFCSTLAENKASATCQILRPLEKAKPHTGSVPGPQALAVHCYYPCCLTHNLAVYHSLLIARTILLQEYCPAPAMNKPMHRSLDAISVSDFRHQIYVVGGAHILSKSCLIARLDGGRVRENCNISIKFPRGPGVQPLVYQHHTLSNC